MKRMGDFCKSLIKKVISYLFKHHEESKFKEPNIQVSAENVKPKWRIEEINKYNYLCQNFGKYAEFVLMGGADSEISDIFTTTKNNKSFFIDSKMKNSQSSQFVVNFDDNKDEFVYSDRDRLDPDANNLEIIKHMNENKELYKNAGTKGVAVLFPGCEEVFKNYIIDNLLKKNIKMIISNDNIIIPTEKITDCFDISCCYRTKKSGSRNVSKKNYGIVSKYLIENKIEYQTRDTGIYVKGLPEKSKFELENDVYYISNTEPDGYSKLRVLSKTANSNIIFKLKLKKDAKGYTNEEVIDFLCAN